MNTIDILKTVAGIISHELALSQDQIFLWNQKYTIPSDKRVYYSISLVTTKVFGTKTEYETRIDGYYEIISENIQATIAIDVMSKETMPIDNCTDIMAALGSTYSQQAQQALSFHIAKLPQNIVPITEEEGTALLYRFNLPIVLQYFKTSEKIVEYYDKFYKTEIVEDKNA